jgi:hypothetical protein
MQVIAEVNWCWMFFEDDGSMYLSVLCGGVAMYLVEFQLSDFELSAYKAGGTQAVASHAAQVRGNPSEYQTRTLQEFCELESVKAATAPWRNSRGALGHEYIGECFWYVDSE